MLSKGVKRYMINPYYGLIPFIFYLILLEITKNVGDSLVISFIFSLLSGCGLRIFTKTSKMTMGFFINQVALFLTFIFWILLKNVFVEYHVYIILPEIFSVIILMILRTPLVTANFKLFRGETPLQKTYINEFFDTITLIQYAFTFHIFISIFYKYMKDAENYSSFADTIIFCVIPVSGVVILILLENIKLIRIIRKLKKEEWLPIVNEKGEVKGKIAKSVSVKRKNKFLHPIVRVALVCKGNIYLQRRNADVILNPRAFDHPFEKYMLFNNEVNITARNSILRVIGKELPFRFLIKYTFKNDDTNRLVFLFVTRVENESEIEDNPALKGKFWNSAEIEKSLTNTPDIFSECFQLEYDYLKNTIINPDLLIQKNSKLSNG